MSDVKELRRWSAELVGNGWDFVWRAEQNGLDRTEEEPDGTRSKPLLWRPDERIDQAFEVLDAVRALDQSDPDVVAEVSFDGQQADCSLLSNSYGLIKATHESRCVAILNCCRAAWQVVSVSPAETSV